MVSGADIQADWVDQWLPVGVQGAAARFAQQLQAVEERSTRAAPVAGSFVAAAIIGITIEKVVQAADDLRNGGGPALLLGLYNQDGREPIGGDPRVPVVRRG